MVAAGPDVPEDALHQGLVTAIHRADRRVWISTPYYLPTEALATALATAARRGLDVRILVPDRSNHRMTDFARGAFLRAAQRHGCQVLRLRGRMIHAKAGMIDDVGWIGSANFDVRSMLLNFEATLFLYDRDSVQRVETWFEGLMPDCDAGLQPARLPRRFAEALFRLSAPLL